MLDLRPVGYVIGLLVSVLGIAMIVPMLVDIAEGRGHWPVFVEAGLITMLGGSMIALACANGVKEGLTIIPVKHVSEVLKHALVREPEAIEWDQEAEDAAASAALARRNAAGDSATAH